jgi:hypothetical protein
MDQPFRTGKKYLVKLISGDLDLVSHRVDKNMYEPNIELEPSLISVGK